MHIYVDADACPAVIKQVLFRASKRTGIALTLVANHPMQIPADAQIKLLQVPSGFDVADHEIVRRAQPGDLVVTGDIPLAAEVLENNVMALNPRGEQYTSETIRGILNMRDFMDTMRSSGVDTRGGPPPLGQRERQEFANALDRILSRHARGTTPK
ncbi:MAG: YaiI/YqxD family protein [Pseudomonadota bacterium]